MTQFVELDFQLENEVLEWSEEYNIDNEALFALIKILKSRWPSPNSCNKNLKTDQEIQCDYSEIFLDTVNSIGNGSLREYLEDLKHNQKAILNELKIIRNETDFENENGSVTSKNDFIENEKLLRFPIESLNHFQSLEEICSRNEKLYKKVIEIFLSNEKVEHGISIQEFLTINFKMILEKKLMLYLAKFFINVYQLESCSIFKCLKDAFLQKFPKENGEQIFSSILMYFKNLLINEEDSILATESISAEETNVEEHLSIDLELISLDLPCNTIKDLFKFEEQCKELNFALISLFKSGPKNDWKSLIFFVMKKVFGQNIISEIEWETANDNKVEVKYLNIIEALVKYVIENFEEVTCEDNIAKVVTKWIKREDTLKQHENKKLKLDSKEDNVIEVELIGSPTCDITENTVEILDYHEEFLEEEENLFNLLPCKTESSFRKFEEAVRTDLNFQEKLKELYFTKYNTLELTDDREDFSDDSKISTHSGKAYDFKPFIEYNIRKIASDEVISIFPSFANEKLYKSENLNCSDISVLKILQECTQQKFACLSTTFIKNQINLFVNKTKENLKNWNIIKKTEECRMKLQSIKPRDIITPDSHSIHLQSIFNLPLNNFESLQDFNLKCLNNEEMSLNLMTMFLQASEYDCNKFVDKNLRKLITENLGGRLTWNGIQENIAMKDFYIMKLLIDATKKHFPQQNEEAIIESIKLALRRFKDRVRKRKISISSIENIEKDNKIYLDASAQKEEEIDNDITQLKRIPCRTIKEFQDFEIFCRKCKNLQTNLKRLFDSNPNVEDIVKFISENLKKIVIDSVLSNFTYNGLKNNIGVKYYTIIRILLDSLIVKNPYISEEEAIKALKKALLLAKDRQRSMYKKRKKN